MANKPKIKDERTHGEKEGGNRKQQQHFLKRKRRQVMSVSNRTKAARNLCTQYNPLSSDNNTAGQQTLMNYPTQRKNERSR